MDDGRVVIRNKETNICEHQARQKKKDRTLLCLIKYLQISCLATFLTGQSPGR
jgi:hypothetical protein